MEKEARSQANAQGEATILLGRVQAGDPRAAEELLPLVYGELLGLASGFFRRQSPGHTLQPTALVHEAYLKLVRSPGGGFANRAHFCAVAAKAMRQILINHAEAKKALKRGGGAARSPLTEVVTPSGQRTLDIIALDEALSRLESLDPRRARIVEMWFFGGLQMEEVAEVLDVSVSTVKREWRATRIWLNEALSAGDSR